MTGVQTCALPICFPVTISWKFGRSDFQIARGGASSYVSSYVNSLSSAPLLYRSCRAFRPRSRASLGFFAQSAHKVLHLPRNRSLSQRIAKYGFIDYKQDSVLSLVRTYYQYLKANPILTDDDKIVLHSARCLTRFCNSSSDVDIESYINKLYRLFL